jgi:hypothetical protein
MGHAGPRPPESLSFSFQLDYPDMPHPRQEVFFALRKYNGSELHVFYDRGIRTLDHKLTVEDPDGDGAGPEVVTLYGLEDQVLTSPSTEAALLARLAAAGY